MVYLTKIKHKEIPNTWKIVNRSNDIANSVSKITNVTGEMALLL